MSEALANLDHIEPPTHPATEGRTDAGTARDGETRTAPALHGLWRPGSGFVLWFHDAAGATSEPAAAEGAAPDVGTSAPPLPEPLLTLLAGRRFRRAIGIVGERSSRLFVPAMTLGVGSAVAVLDATRSLTVGGAVSGDIEWYRHVVDGVRRFVDARAVAPTMVEVAGESLMRWRPVPTEAWRAWATTVTAAAPDVLLDNGGPDALLDFAAAVVDHECRARLATSAARYGPAQPSTSVVAALVGDDPAPTGVGAVRPAAASAWSEWSGSTPRDEVSLVFRLHEPDAAEGIGAEGGDADAVDADGIDADGGGAEKGGAADDGARWRLQVCRRTADGHLDPVAAHRLGVHELDELTTDLAAAVRAFPALQTADADRTSLDFLLTTDTAESLFATGATALGRAGFPVLLPRTIAEVRPTLGVRALPTVGGGAPARMVGLREIREFEWRLALGDGPDAISLTDADLDQLASQQGDLVRLRGVWVRASGAALSRAAAFVATQRAMARSDSPADLGELFGLVTGAGVPVPVPVTDVSGLAWLDEIAATGSLRPAPVAVPASLDARLRPYQQRGLEWLVHLSAHGIGGVLADDMGLGKTVQVIALLCYEREQQPSGPTLIVCPMSVVGNWSRELARFAPALRVRIHHGPDRRRGGAAAAFDDADVVLTTFAVATRDRELLSERAWRRVVVDEAQHVKNVNTAAARALRALSATHRLALTGTPVENRLEDLRAVIDLVNPGLLGSPSTFRARFAEPIERDRDPAAVRRLGALTRPFILRREKTDPAVAGDLPEKTEMTVRANLTVEQAALYRAIVDELMAALRDKQQRALRRRTVLTALTRLKQVCNHPAHYLADGTALTRRGEHRSGKVELLADILSTLVDEGDRALVFTQFAAFGDLLRPWLSELLGTQIPLLHGGVGRADRERMITDFGASDGPPVLLATLRAGGTGLNLTAANHVVHVDRWWNPAVEDQATDRAYRIGQRQRVHVRRFVCVGTLEERIDDLIASKRELSRLTVGAGEHWMSDLGDDELLDLFALRAEAVSE
ncbi:DEAD/DEAH box helicase [Gordonia sinesedis]